MKDRINRIIISFKWLFRLFKNRYYTEHNSVFLDLLNQNNGNYYFDLIQHFKSRDYQIYLFFRPKFLYAHTKYFKSVLDDHDVSPYFLKKPSLKDLLVLDFDSKKKYNCKTINIEYNSFERDLKYDIAFPFGISPIHYIENTLPDFEKERKQERTMRVFFSGNSDKAAYNHPIFEKHFKIPNRWESVEYIMTLFDTTKLAVNQENHEYNKINLKIWNWRPERSENLNSRISNSSWFSTLAQADFFLGLPGIVMPLCYNVIEAMSVGTIPILAYAEYFDPALEDGINCITYKTNAELNEKLKKILEMDSLKIQEIRENVIDYYKTHHSSGKIIQEIEHLNMKTIKMKMYCEIQSIMRSNLKLK